MGYNHYIDVLFDQHTIRNRIQTTAEFLNEDYKDVDDIVLLCVLKGSVNFFSDLSLMLDFNASYEFIQLSSYEGTDSTGEVTLQSTIPNVEGKNVIVIEDIVDTGRTVSYLKDLLHDNLAKDVKVCTLLDKPSRREVEADPDYVVFTIEDQFVVGYGLDFDEQLRNLPYVGIYKQWT
jgi:hypoxanthine phosphoribosyltransferase